MMPELLLIAILLAAVIEEHGSVVRYGRRGGAPSDLLEGVLLLLREVLGKGHLLGIGARLPTVTLCDLL